MYCTGWNKPVLLIALLAPSVLVLAENPAPPQTSFVVNDEYQVGKVREWLFGRDYRQVWATPVELPALDLSKTAGGPSPVAASMADAWMRYLKFHTGQTRGTYVDLLHDYLEPKGYPGNLTDQLGAWYAAGMPV